MLRGAVSIFGRDLLVLRRSLFSELLAVVASPLTLYLAFGFGLTGDALNSAAGSGALADARTDGAETDSETSGDDGRGGSNRIHGGKGSDAPVKR